MNCIDRFAEANPCIYPSGLAVIGVAAAAALAIGIITLLANNQLLNFTAFHLNTAASLGISIPSALVLLGVCAIAIRSCIKAPQPKPFQPLNEGEDVYDPAQPANPTANPDTEEGATPPAPGSLLNPNDTTGKKMGAPGQGGTGNSFTIIPRERA